MTRSLLISSLPFMGLLFLGGCGANIVKSKSLLEPQLTAQDLSIDGTTTLSGQVPDGQTSVEIANLSASEYVRQVVIDLGADFLVENICSTKRIFGRLGNAVCASSPVGLDAESSFVSGIYNGISNLPASTLYRSDVTLFGTAGTMPEPSSHASTNSTSNSTTVTLSPLAGYWDGVRTVSITEGNLVTGNIRAGSSIFGVAGDSSVVNTSAANARATDMIAGRTGFVNGSLVTGTIDLETPTVTDVGAGDENNDSITDIEVTPTSGDLLQRVTIDLGAHFLSDNICAGRTIFGRLGAAMCPEEISAGSAFRSGSLTMRDELEAGTCSDAGYSTRIKCETADVDNIWTPTVSPGEKIANTGADTTSSATNRNIATFSYSSGDWTQTSIGATLVCGTSGNIEARITNCNRQWRASVGSKDGGGTWSLVSRQLLSAVYYEVWRDDKTGLIWSDNLGTASQCAAAGDNEAAGWCQTNAAITESVCAETDFAGAMITNVRGRSGASDEVYHELKGGMGMNSTNPVLWRLPTIKDYTTAYGNGMAHVLPRPGQFWSASIDPGNGDFAMYFYFDASAYFNVYSSARSGSNSVRCVGR